MDNLYYRVGVKRRLPFFRRFHVYRHEVEPDTGRLVLYCADKSVLSITIDRIDWKVYPEYWEVSKNYAKLAQPS